MADLSVSVLMTLSDHERREAKRQIFQALLTLVPFEVSPRYGSLTYGSLGFRSVFSSCRGLRTVYAPDGKFRAESIFCRLYAHEVLLTYILFCCLETSMLSSIFCVRLHVV